MPPVSAATAVTSPVSASDENHVGAFILPCARQVIGRKDRQHQPGEHQHFQRARHAAHGDIDRKRRERHDAAQQPRRDEGAMREAVSASFSADGCTSVST
jgi:hypothetical protein